MTTVELAPPDRIYPPRSPDLTPLDYFLLPNLQNGIFKQSVDIIEDLKVRIITKV